MTTFENRLNRYKAEEDFFLADIWKSEACVYETRHDLTWAQVQTILKKAKKDDKVYRVDIYVEDWYAEPETENLFVYVDGLVKVAYQWRFDPVTLQVGDACAWRERSAG